MSTMPTTAPTALLPAPLAPEGRDRAPGLGRLARIELRKTVDTRAGRWLLAAAVLATVAGIGLSLGFSDAGERTFAGLLGASLLPTGLVLPVIGILAVTSEWSQRTAMTTFALTPRRERVVAAKLLAGLGLGVAATVVAVITAAVANLVGIGFLEADGGWSITAAALGQAALFQVCNVLIGTAIGLLLLNSPLAIVLYFVLPTVIGLVTGLVSALEGVGGWIDTTQTFGPLMEGTAAGGDWGRFAVSIGVWVLVPLVLGLLRVRRSEIS